MIARRLAAVLAVPVLLAAGCSSSSGSGDPTTATSPSGAAGALAAKVDKGVAGLSSAHLDVDAGSLGGTITGDVAFADGKTTASDVTLNQGSGDIEVITVGGTSYAKLPSSHNTTGKPWAKVSADSSNEFVRALAGTLTLTGAATSLEELTGLLDTAGSVVDNGATQIGGVSARRYTVTLDASKASGALADALSLAGSKPLPAQLWLDTKNRPVQIRLDVPLGGQQLTLLVKISKFDAPVSITAPPADQISGD